MTRSTNRAGVAKVATAVLSLLVVFIGIAAPASAAEYRYWGYYQWDGTTWAYATTGPAESNPADGSVEGWRFAASEAGKVPRVAGDFAAICAATPAEDGMKRVAVVIDYGTAQDAEDTATDPPAARGACAVVATGATGSEVLSAVAVQRVEGGLVCALDTYPATGCGDEVTGELAESDETPVELVIAGAAVETPEATAAASIDASASTDSSEESNSSTWLIAGAIAAIAVLTATVVVRRRSAGSNAEADVDSNADADNSA